MPSPFFRNSFRGFPRNIPNTDPLSCSEASKSRQRRTEKCRTEKENDAIQRIPPSESGTPSTAASGLPGVSALPVSQLFPRFAGERRGSLQILSPLPAARAKKGSATKSAKHSKGRSGCW